MFLNLAMAGGLLAALVPIIVHIFHRRRVAPVGWGAMRFMSEIIRNRHSRIFIDRWLLLLVRAGIPLMLALALMRPAYFPGGNSGTVERNGRVASVILIDDSASTGAGRGKIPFDAMKNLVLSYIDTLENGDEISLIPLSKFSAAQSDPVFDRDTVREQLRALSPTGAKSDVLPLLEAGLLQLSRHLNPSAEIILVTDGNAEGWSEEQGERWEVIRRRLQEDDFRKPRLVILSPPREEEYNNIFISDIKLDRLAVAVGKKISIRIAINHIGKHIPAGMRVRFIVDSRVLSEKALELEPGGVREVSFEHVFGKKGSHVISAEIIGAHDSFADDDIRRLAVEAKEGIPVLLVQKNPPEDSSEGLTFLDLALNPGAGNASFFNTRRIGLKEFSEEKLERYGVVVLGDVPALLPSSVVALEKFISGGGGVMISLGDQTDPEIVNRFWYRDGDGFFPVSLEAVHSKNQGFQPAIIESSHPGLTVFSPHGRDVWRGGMVTRYFSFSDAGSSSGEIRNLVELDNGAPLIVERSLQQGRVILVASSLDLSWGKLPTKTAYVPLVRGLVEYLEGRVFPIRNLAPGESLVYGSVVSKPSATDPDGNNLPMETGIWQGRRVYLSDPISKAGIYSVTDSATGDEILYSVSLDPAESAFAGLSQETRNRIFNRVGAIGISQAEKIFRVFSPKSRKPAELWRWFLLAALGLLFFESYITLTQQRQSEMVEDRGNLSGGDL